MYDARLLREILDAQAKMVCRFERDGTIIYVNRAYADAFGSTAEALTGRCLWDVVTPEDRKPVEEQLERLSPECPRLEIVNRVETPAGTRWTLWLNAAVAYDADGQWTVAQSTGEDITARKELEEHRQLLVDELNHRVRNTLMVVQGMAHQTFRNSNVPEAPLQAFNARLHALAAAHTALSRNNWSGSELAAVIEHGLAFCGDDIARVGRTGPQVSLSPNVSVAMVLVLHELATNAVKYGALSRETGRVAIDWDLRGDEAGARRLYIEWKESGGPPVSPPIRSGFGSRLITTSVERQLGGAIALDFAGDGFACRLSFPLLEDAAA